MNLKTNLADKSNYGGSRSADDIKYIVIHYTGNDGDTDENNGKYFANNVVKTSAHYFVDDDSVTLSVPENYIAWHCGTSGTYKHKECRNANSIGIEICDDVKNGTIYPSAVTIANALELTRSLMNKYGIPATNVIRHYDVTGKLCPAYWCGTTTKNNLWKTEFWNKLTAPTVTVKTDPAKSYNRAYAKTWTVTASALNLRTRAGTKISGKTVPVIKSIKKGEEVTCYGYYTRNGMTVWLYVKDRTGAVGFCSKKYLK